MSSTSARCFVCQREVTDFVGLRVIRESFGIDELAEICPTCYCVSGGTDQVVAELYVAMLQATSSGYTDSGFVHTLSQELKRKGGFLALGWASFALDDLGVAEGAFLLAVLPHPGAPGLPYIWCRSRLPVTKGLADAAALVVPQFELPADIPWADGRYFVASIGADGAPVYERHHAVIAATMENAYGTYGKEDFFRMIASGSSNAGFEIMRRFML